MKSKTLKRRAAAPLRSRAKPKAPGAKIRYVLRLYVAGATARSRQAVLRVRQLCADEAKASCDLKVIDIYQQPALARAKQIVATPTLIIELPKPLRRFIGSLAGTTGLAVELDVSPRSKISL